MKGFDTAHKILVAFTTHTDSEGTCINHYLLRALGRTGEPFDNAIHALHQFGPFGNALLERLNILVFQGQFIDAEIQWRNESFRLRLKCLVRITVVENRGWASFWENDVHLGGQPQKGICHLTVLYNIVFRQHQFVTLQQIIFQKGNQQLVLCLVLFVASQFDVSLACLCIILTLKHTNRFLNGRIQPFLHAECTTIAYSVWILVGLGTKFYFNGNWHFRVVVLVGIPERRGRQTAHCHHCLESTKCLDQTRLSCTIGTIDYRRAQHIDTTALTVDMPVHSSDIRWRQHIELRFLSIWPKIRRYNPNQHNNIFWFCCKVTKKSSQDNIFTNTFWIL